MTRRLPVVLAVATLVVCAAVAGPASAAGTDVQLQAATDEDATASLGVTFTTSGNGTVSVPSQLNDGPAQFVFQEWERVDGQDGGSSSEWEAEPGVEYRVEYDVIVENEVADADDMEGVYGETLDVRREGSVVYSEQLTVDVTVQEPSFADPGFVSDTVAVDATRQEPQAVSVEVPIENRGPGVMLVDSVGARDLPVGFSVSGGSIDAQELAAGAETTGQIELAVASGVEPGQYDITAVVEDNLGNTQTFPVTVTVEELLPEFGEVSGPGLSVNVDRVGDGEATANGIVRVQNVGPGTMRLETFRIDDTPQGITAEADTVGGPIDPRSNTQVPYTLSVSRDIRSGTYRLDGFVEGVAAGSRNFEATVDVDVLFPSLGNVPEQSGTVQFDRAAQESATVSFDTPVPNTGAGNMRLSAVGFSNVPAGMEVVDANVGGTVVEPDRQGTAEFTVRVDESVEKGTYQFQAIVEESLGDTESFPVTVSVEKPPILDVGGETVSLGDVLVGQRSETTLSLAEVGDATGIDGVQATVQSSPGNGSLSLDAVRNTQLPAGGETDRTVPVTVADGAPQHETLRWTVTTQPNDERSRSRQVTLTARVIYPPELTNVSATPESFGFDRARPTSDYEQTSTLTLGNAGDLPMTVTSVSASVDGPASLSATAVDVPETVEGLTTEEVDVALTAAPSTPEGEYTFTVQVETADAGSRTLTRTVTVRHETELSVETGSVTFGELTITSERTRAVDVAEELGYQDLENFTVTRVDGPEQFLAVTSRPGSVLPAGESDQIVFALRFGTSARVYEDYEWTYRIDGERADPRTVTVTARPSPYSFDSLRQNLTAVADGGEWREPLAGGVVSTLDRLERQLREEESVGRDTLPTALAMGRAALLYADAVDGAQTAQADGNYSLAQRRVVRAAVARDQLVQFAGSLPGRLRETASPTVDVANRTLSDVVANQRSHYRGLVGEDANFDERARARRALAQLAAIEGDRAAERRNRRAARNATESYLQRVSAASQHRATADAAWRGLTDNATVVVAGQPLVLNPARFDATTARLDEVDTAYAQAVDDYGAAGATAEADTVADRRSTVAGQATIVRYGLYGALGAYALVFLGLVWYVARRALQYYSESNEAALGDFLLDQPVS